MAELADALDSGSSEVTLIQVQVLLPAPYRVFITKVMNTRYFFAYISLFGAVLLLFFLLLCRGWQIVYRYALSAFKDDLAFFVSRPQNEVLIVAEQVLKMRTCYNNSTAR